MAGSHKALVTQIQADEKVLNANKRAMEKVLLHLQCNCAHRDANGSFALIPPSGQGGQRSPYTNQGLYRCKICKKLLDISNISEDDFNRSLDTVDRVFDLVKMHLDIRSEKDQKTLITLSKQQYKLQITLPDAFATIRKGGKKKNRNKGNGGGGGGLVEVSR